MTRLTETTPVYLINTKANRIVRKFGNFDAFARFEGIALGSNMHLFTMREMSTAGFVYAECDDTGDTIATISSYHVNKALAA
jgi:hypothetical protein